MRPTTIRLDEATLSALDSEYVDYGYSDRSDYIRAIIEARDPPVAETATSDYATTDDYERLRERVAEIEERVADLEAADSSGGLNQQTGSGDADSLVKTGSGDIEVGGPPSPGRNPHTQTVDKAVAYAREHQPVTRSEILEVVGDDVDIRADSLWKRHVRDALKEAGFEYDRSGGVATWSQNG
jgi:hypothetical protein